MLNHSPLHFARSPAPRLGAPLFLAFGCVIGCGDGEVSEPAASTVAPSLCTPSETLCADYGNERPFRPSEHSAVHATETGEMIIFGGSKALPDAMCGPGPANYTNETWIYSEACNAWQQITAEGPSARSRHAAAFGDGQMWVFGGRFRAKDSVRGDYTLLDDLWRFDVSERSWSRVDPDGASPEARSNSAMAWDSKRNLLWLFSGNASAAAFSYAFIDDLWSYDPEDNSWQRHEVGGEAPSPRLWHSLIYDVSRDRLVVYGGMDAASAPADYLSDVYAIDVSTFSGTELHAGTDAAPDPRFWGSLVYRPERRDYVAFGGHDATALGNRNDTYRFNPGSNTWTLLHAGDSFNKPPNAICDFPPDFANVDAEQPERRHAASLVWSASCDRALLFGGKSDCGIIDDVWALTDGEWQLLQAALEGEVCLRWRDEQERCTNLCQ